MIAATDFLARSFTWRLPGAAAARGLGLAALQALPPVTRLAGAADDVRLALSRRVSLRNDANGWRRTQRDSTRRG